MAAESWHYGYRAMRAHTPWSVCLLCRLAEPTLPDQIGQLHTAMAGVVAAFGMVLLPAMREATVALAEFAELVRPLMRRLRQPGPLGYWYPPEVR